MSDRDYTNADLEIQIAKMSGRKPNLEQFGNTLGLAIEGDGRRPLEKAARDAAMGAVTIHAREVVSLGQSRAGMSREAAEQMVNEVCSAAYEKASKQTAFESDRFKVALEALKSKGGRIEAEDATRHRIAVQGYPTGRRILEAGAGED